MQFEYVEDRKFFADLLAGGDETRLDSEFSDYFDFRDPAIKRLEFNEIRKRVLVELIEKHGEVCHWHPIPLSTNELNKRLRRMVRVSNRKVPSQSFGSNHPKNLVLSANSATRLKNIGYFRSRTSRRSLSSWAGGRQSVLPLHGSSRRRKGRTCSAKPYTTSLAACLPTNGHTYDGFVKGGG
jgi:hypothetical protein